MLANNKKRTFIAHTHVYAYGYWHLLQKGVRRSVNECQQRVPANACAIGHPYTAIPLALRRGVAQRKAISPILSNGRLSVSPGAAMALFAVVHQLPEFTADTL